MTNNELVVDWTCLIVVQLTITFLEFLQRKFSISSIIEQLCAMRDLMMRSLCFTTENVAVFMYGTNTHSVLESTFQYEIIQKALNFLLPKFSVFFLSRVPSVCCCVWWNPFHAFTRLDAYTTRNRTIAISVVVISMDFGCDSFAGFVLCSKQINLSPCVLSRYRDAEREWIISSYCAMWHAKHIKIFEFKLFH